jgi:hypothetical protein
VNWHWVRACTACMGCCLPNTLSRARVSFSMRDDACWLVTLCGRPFTSPVAARAPYISAGRGVPACMQRRAGRPARDTDTGGSEPLRPTGDRAPGVHRRRVRCVCLSLSLTHTQSTSTCSAAAMPTADVRRRSLSSTTRRRTYSRAAHSRCGGLHTTVVHRLPSLLVSTARTTPSHIPSSHFSPLIEAHTCTSRQRDR